MAKDDDDTQGDLDDDDAVDPALSDFHPLVRGAAAEGWAREDYPAALRSAWFALRDLLRARLNAPHLDGVDLVNAIGEDKPPISLPLTEYITTTEKNMHRGVVNFLRGVVYYVRNPEAHEGESLARDDRVGALERLAVMSLCARHVEVAAPPAAVEEAVTELMQAGFPKKTEAMEDLIDGIPLRRRSELATVVLREARAAFASKDQAAVDKSSLFYPLILSRSGWDEALVVQAAAEVTALIAADDTLSLGVLMLPVRVFGRLKLRHQMRVEETLIRAAGSGRTDTPRGDRFDAEITYLFRRLRPEARKELVHALARGVRDSESKRFTWSFAQARHIASDADESERQVLAHAVADAAVGENGGRVLARAGLIEGDFLGDVLEELESLSVTDESAQTRIDELIASLRKET